MKIIGSLSVFLTAFGLTWGIFNRNFLIVAYIGVALSGLYFYGKKGAH